ncbi:hypothetical protein [Belnapia rosea]|uniref:hypothetical protein n=1 Tax=Belnapia rosea TaxID=938405 RepID=UPI000888A4BA|nr:hypothetical protein [Belnapia rosea]SDB75052.1 hypothetical protein SAMN02927895_05760 [Belnapia rosea]
MANAMAFAAARGTPLTVHATFHLRFAEGFTEASWASFQTTFLDKIARWLKRRGIPVAYAWTRECGPVKGPHLHLLLHLPCAHWKAFKRFVIFAGRFQESDGVSQAVVLSGAKWGMWKETMQAGALRYLLKSLDASASTLEALGIRPEATCPVMVKRCGVSTTLAQKARREARWIELRSLPELHGRLNPANNNQVEVRHAVA